MSETQKDQIIVVDIEATCWKRVVPEGEQSEIIEVGICTLDVETLIPDKKCSILVRPTRSKVSHFCTKLTTLTQELVDTGGTFAEACQIVETSYDAKRLLWSSWGDYDHKMFQQQCQDFEVPYPFSDHHVNLKQLFADVANNGQKVGMMRATKMIEHKATGVHHRGADDAWNTAHILAHLLRTYGQNILDPYW